MLVSVSLDCTIILWQLVTGDPMKVVDTQKALLCCAMCPLNNNFVVVCEAGDRGPWNRMRR